MIVVVDLVVVVIVSLQSSSFVEKNLDTLVAM